MRALGDHLARGFLHAQPHRLGVDVHDHVPVVFIDIHEEPGLVQAGVEETHIDRAEGVDRGGDGGGVVLALGDVHLDRDRLAVAGGVDARRRPPCASARSRSPRQTLAPCAAKASALAAPMPRAAPVIRMFFPFRRLGSMFPP
jgi:hypothetical protein